MTFKTPNGKPGNARLNADDVLMVELTGAGAGGGADREIAVTQYRVKTAFTGASVSDTITAIRVLDVSSSTASQVGATVWYNETTAAALASAPAAANLEPLATGGVTNAQLVAALAGGPALTNTQLRAAPVIVVAGQITTTTATIANAASVSADIDLGTARLGRIAMPAAWTAADLTLQTSHDNVTWNSLYDKDGVEYTLKAAAARSVLVPLSDMLSVRYLRIRSGTAALPVAQGAARVLTLVLVP